MKRILLTICLEKKVSISSKFNDMDYFLNEEDPFDDLFGEEGFYIF